MSIRSGVPLSRAGALRRTLARTATAGLLAALGATIASGCETGPQLTPEAQPLGDSVMKLATVYDDRIVFPASAEAQLADVAEGDVLVSGYDHGLLRRVDAIEAAGSTIVLRTSEAALTDAVVSGSTQVTIEPGASPASLDPMAEPAGFGQTFSADLSNRVIYSADGVTLRIKQGSLVFQAGIDVGLDIRDSKIQSARAIASGDLKVDLTTEVEGKPAVKIHEEMVLWASPELDVPLPPIGVPPVVVPVKASGRLVITGIFDADADGRITVQVKQSFDASGEMGLRYAQGSGFERIGSFSPDWTLDSPTLSAEGRLDTRAALRAELQVGLYGAVSKLTLGGGRVDVWAEPFLSAHAQATDALDWRVDGGLDVGARARLKVLWWDFPTEDYTTNVITKKLLPQNDGEAVPSGAGDCANGLEDGFESDADCGGACAVDCGAGQECASGEDCETGVCDGGACVPATCADGVLDEGEEDIDCGGVCSPCVGEEVPLGCDNGTHDGDEEDVDCGGSCPPCGGPVCPDGYCDAGEDAFNCPSDCAEPVCGDGVCDVTENEVGCPGDCGAGSCGDGVCDFNGTEPVDCPQDCCGDGYCDPGEDAVCPSDCG